MIKKKINVDEYKFLSGKTIDEILKTQTSWKNDRECLLSIINNDISSVSDFADKKDIQALNKIKAASENPETDLRTLAVHSDIAIRYISFKHFDQQAFDEGKRPYLTNIVNVTAQDEFPWELPDFIKDDLEEYPDFSMVELDPEAEAGVDFVDEWVAPEEKVRINVDSYDSNREMSLNSSYEYKENPENFINEVIEIKEINNNLYYEAEDYVENKSQDYCVNNNDYYSHSTVVNAYIDAAKNREKQIEKLTEQVNSLQSAFTNSTTITVPQFDSNGNPVMKSNGEIATAKLNCPKGINVALGKLARENMILRSENQQLRNQLNNQNINNDMSGFDR